MKLWAAKQMQVFWPGKVYQINTFMAAAAAAAASDVTASLLILGACTAEATACGANPLLLPPPEPSYASTVLGPRGVDGSPNGRAKAPLPLLELLLLLPLLLLPLLLLLLPLLLLPELPVRLPERLAGNACGGGKPRPAPAVLKAVSPTM